MRRRNEEGLLFEEPAAVRVRYPISESSETRASTTAGVAAIDDEHRRADATAIRGGEVHGPFSPA